MTRCHTEHDSRRSWRLPRHTWWICGCACLLYVELQAAELCTEKSAAAVKSLLQYLKTPADQRPELASQPFAGVALTRSDAQRAAKSLTQDHRTQIRRERQAEMKDQRLRLGKLEMPFSYIVYGKKPSSGRSLYLSLHGGGGAPKAVNDQQWENQKRLYRPAEGVYLAPRAPTNTWNLWHQGHIDAFFDRLIENLIVFEDVDPNRVYVMGYSAGGDGIYQLAPRRADRWAAAAMMAGHPNDASPLSLRNIGFTLHMGGRDSAYKRNQVARNWKEKLAQLRTADPQGYRHLVQIHEDKGHWMDREDAVAVPWMAKFRRDPFPKRIVWKQDDVSHVRFYWLAVSQDQRRGRSQVIAVRKQQLIELDSQDVQRVIVRLNDKMLNLDQPVQIQSGGRMIYDQRLDRTIATLAQTLAERGDPRSVFSAQVEVTLKSEPATE